MFLFSLSVLCVLQDIKRKLRFLCGFRKKRILAINVDPVKSSRWNKKFNKLRTCSARIYSCSVLSTFGSTRTETQRLEGAAQERHDLHAAGQHLDVTLSKFSSRNSLRRNSRNTCITFHDRHAAALYVYTARQQLAIPSRTGSNVDVEDAARFVIFSFH